MNNTRSGRLIVFEGIDGTGKSTQISLLGKYLTDKGYEVVLTREPTDGAFGRRIRELFTNRRLVSRREELELFLADRREHVDAVLLPALQTGKVVLCDRYFLSTVAYQGANGLDPGEILRLNDFAPVPDLALIFEISVATSLKRITRGRGEQPNEFEQADMLARVSNIFAGLDLPYLHRIDAENGIAEIHREVVSAVRKVLPQPVPEPLA